MKKFNDKSHQGEPPPTDWGADFPPEKLPEYKAAEKYLIEKGNPYPTPEQIREAMTILRASKNQKIRRQ